MKTSLSFANNTLHCSPNTAVSFTNCRETSGIHQQSASSSSPEDVGDTRKAIRAAIENTTQERNRTEILLLSFTTVSGYEAVEIFNRRKYKGHDDWELRASGVKFSGGTGRDLMTVQEAVDTASLLRREEHIAQNAAQAFKQDQA